MSNNPIGFDDLPGFANAPAGQTIVTDGSGKGVLTSYPTYYYKTTITDVNSTIAATDLFNGEFTILANAMGINGSIRITAILDFLNNSGGAVNPPRLALKFGATTILDTGPAITNTLPSSASRYGGILYAHIQNLGAANSQTAGMSGKFVQAQASAVGNSGIGISASGLEIDVSGSNSGLSVDTTTSLALALTTVNASNNLNYSTRVLSAFIEVIKAP